MNNEKRSKQIYSSQNIKRAIFFIVNCYLLIVNCFALDFSFRPKFFASFPMGAGNIDIDGNEIYSIGGGGDIGFDIDLSTIWANPLGLGYTAGVEGGMLLSPTLGNDANTYSFYSFGGGLGLYFFPLSRLFTRIDGAAGVYLSTSEGVRGDPGLYWRAGGEIGFRFTPTFTLAANAGWRQYQGTVNKEKAAINSGVYAGLTAQITFQSGTTNREAVGANLDQYDAVYPVFMQLYQSTPIGSVILRNNENAEIRDVRVFFRAGNYTASEFLCGTVSIIPRGRTVELPMLADFSPEILRFTDSGRVLGELVIRYRFLGQEREAVRAVSVATNNRNTVTIGDAAALAAFISPTSPELLDFARFIAGLARTNNRTGHNANMQNAIWFIEGLRASGIQLGKTFFEETEAQYPAETLLFGTGSSRDFALLFAAGMEAVGIKSAFIQVRSEKGEVRSEEERAGGELLVAVNLGIGQSAAETLFNGNDRILIVNDDVWLPLSMTAFNDGFMACWNEGAAVLNRAFDDGLFADFVLVEEAWAVYPPAPLPVLGRNVIQTDDAAAIREANRALQAYIDQEILPLIRSVSSEQGAVSNAAIQNRLGILYARAGRIAEAKAAYERAAGMGSVPAMTNRGNLALTENDFATAERWFRQVLTREPENRTALRGLERLSGR
jgi:tetratricopeptide (TPR) repeat protein